MDLFIRLKGDCLINPKEFSSQEVLQRMFDEISRRIVVISYRNLEEPRCEGINSKSLEKVCLEFNKAHKY